MLSKEEKREIENKIAELNEQLDENYVEEFLTEAVGVEDKYLGKCYRKGEKYYRIVSVFTYECPYQLWAVMFNSNPEIRPRPIHRKWLRREEMHRYDAFDCDWVSVVKVPNNLFEKPEKNMVEILQEEFIEAFRNTTEKMEANLLKTFSACK